MRCFPTYHGGTVEAAVVAQVVTTQLELFTTFQKNTLAICLACFFAECAAHPGQQVKSVPSRQRKQQVDRPLSSSSSSPEAVQSTTAMEGRANNLAGKAEIITHLCRFFHYPPLCASFWQCTHHFATTRIGKAFDTINSTVIIVMRWGRRLRLRRRWWWWATTNDVLIRAVGTSGASLTQPPVSVLMQGWSRDAQLVCPMMPHQASAVTTTLCLTGGWWWWQGRPDDVFRAHHVSQKA